ncbi:MAG: methylated-DNA--[protein]-cysteine S-methyltransferase [Gammaproteobacteria bacterium]|nr:methylated-DNA--[protein]-cysteine S-methyltransferase [Gammaproteobacteria bacterium]
MYCDYFESPLGLIEFKASELGLSQVIFCGATQGASNASDITDNCKLQLSEYFAGQRTKFELALDPQGTEFQKSVWQCLSQIPFGEVASYKDIAKMVNRPKGSQAVGGANGRNPISIIVPCHRVIGSNGSLTGYAGGIERKLWLLNHEGVTIEPTTIKEQLNLAGVIATRQAKTQYLT